MVDVSDKPATARRAVAEALVVMDQETLSSSSTAHAPKGDVLTVAELAGDHGREAHRRAHPALPSRSPLTDVGVEITPGPHGRARCASRAHAATTGPTGVEMEALTAASIAALTVYDMLKCVDRGIEHRGPAAHREARRQVGRLAARAAPTGRADQRPPGRRGRPAGRRRDGRCRGPRTDAG